MSAVSGTRRAMKELVDGTIRVQVDIDPQHRRAFLELFPDIDMPMALAPLVRGFEQPLPATDRKIVEAAAEAVKGGALAKLAGMLCGDPGFQGWLAQMNRGLWRHHQRIVESDDAETAATLIRVACGIRSRAELDHNEEAAQRFHQQFRLPYNSYVSERARA